MESNPGVTGPLNLGNTEEFTIRELAEKVIAMTGSGSSIKFCALPTDDPMQRQPDIALVHATLGWEPKISLEEGLKKTIPYFESLLRKDIR